MSNKMSTIEARFASMRERLEDRDSFHIDAAKVEVAEQVFLAMEENDITEAELARRLVVSRAYVNKILKGTANLTIESLVKIGRALNRNFTFEFGKIDSAAIREKTRKTTSRSAASVMSAVESFEERLPANVIDMSKFKMKKAAVSVAEVSDQVIRQEKLDARL